MLSCEYSGLQPSIRPKGFQDSSSGTVPHVSPTVYLMSAHITKSPRPSPSIFAYCKAIKHWRWEWPQNELYPKYAFLWLMHHPTLSHCCVSLSKPLQPVYWCNYSLCRCKMPWRDQSWGIWFVEGRV